MLVCFLGSRWIRLSTYLRVAVGGGLALLAGAGGPWGQGPESIDLDHVQGGGLALRGLKIP